MRWGKYPVKICKYLEVTLIGWLPLILLKDKSITKKEERMDVDVCNNL